MSWLGQECQVPTEGLVHLELPLPFCLMLLCRLVLLHVAARAALVPLQAAGRRPHLSRYTEWSKEHPPTTSQIRFARHSVVRETLPLASQLLEGLLSGARCRQGLLVEMQLLGKRPVLRKLYNFEERN